MPLLYKLQGRFRVHSLQRTQYAWPVLYKNWKEGFASTPSNERVLQVYLVRSRRFSIVKNSSTHRQHQRRLFWPNLYGRGFQPDLFIRFTFRPFWLKLYGAAFLAESLRKNFSTQDLRLQCLCVCDVIGPSGLWTYQPGSHNRRKVTQDFPAFLPRGLPYFFS